VTPAPVTTKVDVSTTTDCGADAPGESVPDADADGKAPSAEPVPERVCDHDGVIVPVRVPDVVAVTGDLDTVDVADVVGDGVADGDVVTLDEPVEDVVDEEDPVEDDDVEPDGPGDADGEAVTEIVAMDDSDAADDCEADDVLVALVEPVSLSETLPVTEEDNDELDVDEIDGVQLTVSDCATVMLALLLGVVDVLDSKEDETLAECVMLAATLRVGELVNDGDDDKDNDAAGLTLGVKLAVSRADHEEVADALKDALKLEL
jgi:hypothetical protein